VFANHRAYWKTGISVVLMLAASGPATAQSDRQRTRVFALEEAVAFALENYPAVRASLERLRAAEAGVTVGPTSYLPRTDVLWQSNRATDNNITGLTLSNSVIAPITGPVPLSPSNRSAWVREGAEAAKSALKSMITGGCRGKQQSSDDSTISLPGYGPRLSSAFRPLPVRHSRGRLCCSFRGREDADHAGRTRRQQFGRAFELRDVS